MSRSSAPGATGEVSVTWGAPTSVVTVQALVELDGVLDRLQSQFVNAGEQHLVIVDNAVEAALLIGLGGSQSLLSWSGGDGADLISRGDGLEEPYVAYRFNGHESEFSGTGAMPIMKLTTGSVRENHIVSSMRVDSSPGDPPSSAEKPSVIRGGGNSSPSTAR